MSVGLYVHVPFCSSICHYCNFNRGLLDAELKRRYVDAIVREIARVGESAGGAGADTLFFGGGTPSLLDPTEIGAIIAACRGAFALAADAEVTLEANPETVSPEGLEALRVHGVNRLSLGVQSFRDDELRRLGRVHDSRRARLAFADARRAGFDNVSLDLMMWLPGQSLPDWEASIEGLIDLRPEHASLYMLELYPNAPLREEMARGGWSLSPDDEAAAMYERAMGRLESVGYEHYEISNVAMSGRRSRHNLKYWRDGEWFGFGPGAHSTWRGARWKNVSDTSDYVEGVAAGRAVTRDRRDLTAEERWQEAVMMGLRLSDGIAVEEFRTNYGLDLLARYGDHLQPSIEAGLLVIDEGRLRLTRQGMLMANEVLAVFF